MKLKTRNIDVKVSVSDLQVVVKNANSIKNSISKLDDVIKYMEEKTGEELDQTLISELEEQLTKSYITDGILTLCSNDAEEDISETINKISDLLKEAIDGTLTDEEIQELINTQSVDDFLEETGLSDDLTDEELQDIAEEAADELATAVVNGDEESDNPITNSILQQLLDRDKGKKVAEPKGLRKDYYTTMSSIQSFHDVASLIYSTGLATDTANYFKKGLMLITMHSGGSCIFGVGTAILFNTSNNIPPETLTIQSGAEDPRFPNEMYQAQGLRDGFSNEITNGTTTGITVGVKVSGDSVRPYVSMDKKANIQHPPVKILIFVAALAAIILLETAAILAQGIGNVISSEMVDVIKRIKEQILTTIKERIIDPLDEIKDLKINELKQLIDDTNALAKEKLEKELNLIAEKIQPKIDEIANITLSKVETGVNSLINKVSNNLKKNSLVKKVGESATKRIDSITKKALAGVKAGKEKALESSQGLAQMAAENTSEKIENMSDEEVQTLQNKISEEYAKLNQFETDIKTNVTDKVNQVEDKIDNIIKTAGAGIGVGGEDLFKKVLGIPETFADGNDLFAAMLAASVKASIALSPTTTTDASVGSNGNGLLIPIGP